MRQQEGFSPSETEPVNGEQQNWSDNSLKSYEQADLTPPQTTRWSRAPPPPQHDGFLAAHSGVVQQPPQVFAAPTRSTRRMEGQQGLEAARLVTSEDS